MSANGPAASSPQVAMSGRLRLLVQVLELVARDPILAVDRIKFQLLYRWRFRSCGPRTCVRNPLTIIKPRYMSIGVGTMIRDGARLEVVCRPGLAPGDLRIGNHVSIEQGVHIAACDHVIIEDDVCFSVRCVVIDSSHPEGAPGDGNRVNRVNLGRSHVIIRRRVFLGANVVVLPNVEIGENSIIGANSVVTRDIPANTVAVGSPARPIRRIVETRAGDSPLSKSVTTGAVAPS